MSGYPSQFRQEPLTGRWTLIAAGRARRPHDQPASIETGLIDPFDPAEVPPRDIVDMVANDDSTKFGVTSSWKTLAIKNAYPFLSTDGRRPHLRGTERDGYGFHEIVIHSPDADKNFEDFSPEQTAAVIELFFKRYNHLSHQPQVKHVQIFTNRGPEAGASVAHPHSQIVALPMIPPYVEGLVARAKAHQRQHGGSLARMVTDQESHDATRIIYENSKFLVYCPYAPQADYHIRILPRQPGSFFHEITADQVDHLARVLNLAFRRLDRIAGIPPYNAFIRTGPVGTKRLPGFRWHIDIVPHLNIPGGLELSTGLDVVTVAPEEAARALRQDS